MGKTEQEESDIMDDFPYQTYSGQYSKNSGQMLMATQVLCILAENCNLHIYFTVITLKRHFLLEKYISDKPI